MLNDEDFEHINSGETLTLIPEGLYPARWKGRTSKVYPQWGEKLIFDWEVYISPKLNESVQLQSYYNLKRDNGGRFKFGHHHAYRKDWICARGGKVGLDKNSLPLTVFQNGLLLILVVTVRRDNRGPMHSSSHWSKVSRILRPVEDGESFKGLPIQVAEFFG